MSLNVQKLTVWGLTVKRRHGDIVVVIDTLTSDSIKKRYPSVFAESVFVKTDRDNFYLKVSPQRIFVEQECKVLL